MENKKLSLMIVIVVLAIPFIYAGYLYPSLPASIPTHFNIKGEADGWGGPDSIFLGPGIIGFASLFTYFLMANLKKIDPIRNKQVDDSFYQNMGVMSTLFLSCVSMVILYTTVHPGVQIEKILFPLLGIGFASIGWYFPKFSQNYFAGFKLPWTLENESNWIATHKVAGKVWVVGGCIQVVAGIVLSAVPSFIIFFANIILMVVVPTIFSYRMFKNGNKLP
jgi:hypothetical protein